MLSMPPLNNSSNKTTADRIWAGKDAAALERRIGRFAYRLYGLTEEEIKIAELVS